MAQEKKKEPKKTYEDGIIQAIRAMIDWTKETPFTYDAKRNKALIIAALRKTEADIMDKIEGLKDESRV